MLAERGNCALALVHWLLVAPTPELTTPPLCAPCATTLYAHRRHAEVALALKQTFETVVHTHLYQRSEIDVHVQVIQADGGELSAAINAATLALVDAGIAMQDLVVACNAGYLDSTPLLGERRKAAIIPCNHGHDPAHNPPRARHTAATCCVVNDTADLNYIEKAGGGPVMPVALLPKSDKVRVCGPDTTQRRPGTDAHTRAHPHATPCSTMALVFLRRLPAGNTGTDGLTAAPASV